jgi:hypothetical protein
MAVVKHGSMIAPHVRTAWYCAAAALAALGCHHPGAEKTAADKTWHIEERALAAATGAAIAAAARPLDPTKPDEKYIIDQAAQISAFLGKTLDVRYSKDVVQAHRGVIAIDPAYLRKVIGQQGADELEVAVRFVLLHEFGHVLQCEEGRRRSNQPDCDAAGRGARERREFECQADIVGGFVTALQDRVEYVEGTSAQVNQTPGTAGDASESSRRARMEALLTDIAWRLGSDVAWRPADYPTRFQRGVCVGSGIELGSIVALSAELESSTVNSLGTGSAVTPGRAGVPARVPRSLPALSAHLGRLVGVRSDRPEALSLLYGWSAAAAQKVVAIDLAQGSGGTAEASVRQALAGLLTHMIRGSAGWRLVRGRAVRGVQFDGNEGMVSMLHPSFPDPWRCFAYESDYAFCYLIARKSTAEPDALFDATLRDIRAGMTSTAWSMLEHRPVQLDRPSAILDFDSDTLITRDVSLTALPGAGGSAVVVRLTAERPSPRNNVRPSNLYVLVVRMCAVRGGAQGEVPTCGPAT